jgi:hypothetical protein
MPMTGSLLSVPGMAELPRGQTDSTPVRSLRPLQCCVRSWGLPLEDVSIINLGGPLQQGGRLRIRRAALVMGGQAAPLCP